MNKEVRAELRAVFKLTVIEYDKICKNTAQVCREFGVPRSSFYEWKKAYEAESS
jgi:transposase-like protein